MLPYLLMAVSSTTGIIEGTVIKIHNRRHSNGGFLFTGIVSCFSMVVFLLRYLFTDGEKGDFTLAVIPFAIIAGIFYCSASFLTYIALNIGSFAISMTVLSYSTLITCAYGIFFLNESANAITYIGFGLFAIALFLLRGERSKGEIGGFSVKWIVCIGLSVILQAGFSIITRMQQEVFSDTVSNEYYIITLFISASILLTVGGISAARRGELRSVLRHGLPYAVIAGSANGITNFLSLIIHMLIEISKSSPITSFMKRAATIAVSFLLFKERFLPRQIVGLLVSLAAIIAITIGG